MSDTPNPACDPATPVSYRPFLKCLVGGPLITAVLFLIPWSLVGNNAWPVILWVGRFIGGFVALPVSAMALSPVASLFVLLATLLSAICVGVRADHIPQAPVWIWPAAFAAAAASMVLLAVLLFNFGTWRHRWHDMVRQQPTGWAAAQVDRLPVQKMRELGAAVDNRATYVHLLDTHPPEASRAWSGSQKEAVGRMIYRLTNPSMHYFSPVECRRLVAGYLASSPAVQSRYALEIEGQRIGARHGAQACRSWDFSQMEFSLAP